MNLPAMSPGSPQDPPPASPSLYFIHLAIAWISGTLLGFGFGHAQAWMGVACVGGLLAILSIVTRRGEIVARVLAGMAVVAAAAAWTDARTQFTSPNDVRQFIAPTPRLARFIGIVDDTPSSPPPNHGPFSRFIYRSPSTTFTLRVESISKSAPESSVSEATDTRPAASRPAAFRTVEQPVEGKLQISIREVETRLNPGDRVAVTGWVYAFEPPSNPGEFDHARYMSTLGIAGRMTVEHRDLLQFMSPAPQVDPHRLTAWSDRFESASLASLRIGMPEDPELLAFVDALFVGKRGPDLDQLNDSFKRTGLAHILCISGLHFSIFLGMIWFLARLVLDSPRRIGIVVLSFLLIYVVMLPVQVAIIRSSIMAAAVCLGAMSGRRSRSVDMMALAAVVILIWRPTELFSAGAQLSFVGVASLLLLTNRVAGMLYPAPPRRLPNEAAPGRLEVLRGRFLTFASEYFASGLVPSVLTMPIVAYHFALLSPPTVFFSLVAGPFVLVVLSLGFVKMLAGILFPSVSLILSWPLVWACYGFMAYIKAAASLPGATFDLAPSPSAAWAIVTLMTLVALFAGQFHARPFARYFCLAICLFWLIEPHPVTRISQLLSPPPAPAITLRALSVSNGACYVLSIPPLQSEPSATPAVIMYDCGSQSFLDVGSRSIHPALVQFHIRGIDTLILSHANLDRYSGVVDIIERHPVGQVILTPYFLQAAQSNSRGPEAIAIASMKAHKIPIQTVTAPHHLVVNGVQIDILNPPGPPMPPTQTQPATTSRALGAKSRQLSPADASIVVSFRSQNRRILLTGGIQQPAIKSLLDSNSDLAADVADVPHHGTQFSNSEDFYRAIRPSILIESTGSDRYREDPWTQLVAPGTTLLNTGKQGMVEIRILGDGKIETSTFRSSESNETRFPQPR